MPATDSAICAVTAAIRFRVSTSATCDARWNQRVRTSAGGRSTNVTRPSRQSAMNSAMTAAGQQHDVRDERRHALREHVGDGVDVARQARDDPARLLLREVAKRESRQVVEEVAPEPDHDRLADRGEPADEHGLEDPADGGDGEIDATTIVR